MKLWARIELDYINHDKFKAITGNAIALWHEAKNYCDLRHTDGLIPLATAKQFRFFGPRSVAMLTTSAGVKPGTDEQYQPLWSVVDGVGYQMHDYVAHNDCREKVLGRIKKADDVRAQQAENQRTYRERRQEERRKQDAGAPPVTATVIEKNDNATDNAAVVESITSRVLSDKHKHIQKQKQKHLKELTEKSGGSKRPIYTSDRFAVFEWQLDELSKILGSHLDAFDLHGFFDGLSQQSRQSGLVIPKQSVWDWLQQQVLAEARRRGLPMASVEPEAQGSKRVAGLAAGGAAFLTRRQG